jgi:hypothetical protein
MRPTPRKPDPPRSAVEETLALVDGLAARGVPPAEAAKVAAEILRAGPGQRLLTPVELAAIVNRSPRTVETWIQNEAIPVVKTGEGTVIGIHFPTFMACCTRYLPGKGKVGDLAARLVVP